jgi:hypothetical protein
LESLLPKGATPEEFTELVRAKLAEFLFSLAYRLEDPMHEDEELQAVSWGLFITDEQGNPVAPLTGLHESVLQSDATGREGRPRGST